MKGPNEREREKKEEAAKISLCAFHGPSKTVEASYKFLFGLIEKRSTTSYAVGSGSSAENIKGCTAALEKEEEEEGSE